MKLFPYTIAATTPALRDSRSAWTGHVPFAFALTELLQPDVIVELGVHTGVSYCAFAQAVSALRLKTRLYGVDTWLGDASTGSYDGVAILSALRAHHDPLYKHFSKLLQLTCDEAAPLFSNYTVDILHIDAGHSYKEVKRDFFTWLPTMSPRGVVLFHDTEHREPSCNVRRFWREIRTKYPHFEFKHSYGLGVLFVGSKPTPDLSRLLEANATKEGDEIREYFKNLGGNAMLQTMVGVAV